MLVFWLSIFLSLSANAETKQKCANPKTTQLKDMKLIILKTLQQNTTIVPVPTRK